MQKPAQIRLIVVLICGIFAVSTASILIRSALDDGVPPLVVAAYRLTFATLILTPIVLRSRTAELRRLTRRDWLLGAVVRLVSGAALCHVDFVARLHHGHVVGGAGDHRPHLGGAGLVADLARTADSPRS